MVKISAGGRDGTQPSDARIRARHSYIRGALCATGTLGCEALNISDEAIASLAEPCKSLSEFISALGKLSVPDGMMNRVREAAAKILDAMKGMEPFAHLDYGFYASGIADTFSSEALAQVRALNVAMLTRGLAAAQEPGLRKGALLSRIAPVLAQLAYSLAEYKRTMTALAESLNYNNVERTPDGLAASFGEHFDVSDDSLMTLANASVQYVSVGEPPKLARRMNYVSLVGLLRSDLFEGLAAGHGRAGAPSAGDGSSRLTPATRSIAAASHPVMRAAGLAVSWAQCADAGSASSPPTTR